MSPRMVLQRWLGAHMPRQPGHIAETWRVVGLCPDEVVLPVCHGVLAGQMNEAGLKQSTLLYASCETTGSSSAYISRHTMTWW